MRRNVIVAVLVVAVMALSGPVSAHEGGHGPCRGGAPAALPAFGFLVEPGPEFGSAIKGLATGETLGQPTSVTVAQLHAGFCDLNSAPPAP